MRIPPALPSIAVLMVSLVLRFAGLGWGLPAYTPGLLAHTPYRSSYHLDEDNFLAGLVQMRPTAGDFDIKDYHWGTLQFYLVFGVLEAGEWTGLLPNPWQTAYVEGQVAVLPRLYVLGRLISVAAGGAATWIVMALGRALGGRTTGLMSGTIYAVAPLAVMEAHYLTNDVTMSALVAGAVAATVRAIERGRLRWLIGAGLLLGLATAAKYSGLGAAPALLAGQAALWTRPPGRRRWLLVFGPWLALAVGFILAEPQALLASGAVLAGLAQTAASNTVNVATSWKAPLGMLRWQILNLGAWGLTWAPAALAAGGLGILSMRVLRPPGRASGEPGGPVPRLATVAGPDAVVLAALAGITAGLLLNSVFVVRYTQPLLPLLAVAAGLGCTAIPGRLWPALAGAAAFGSAAVITLGQLSLLSDLHPASQLATWLAAHAAPGQQIARPWPEYPVLDETRYALVRIDPWVPALPTAARPDFVVMDDMEFNPPTAGLRQTLAEDYLPVARFAARPHLGPFAWDEGAAPHDWKYSHPTFTVYAHK